MLHHRVGNIRLGHHRVKPLRRQPFKIISSRFMLEPRQDIRFQHVHRIIGKELFYDDVTLTVNLLHRGGSKRRVNALLRPRRRFVTPREVSRGDGSGCYGGLDRFNFPTDLPKLPFDYHAIYNFSYSHRKRLPILVHQGH